MKTFRQHIVQSSSIWSDRRAAGPVDNANKRRGQTATADDAEIVCSSRYPACYGSAAVERPWSDEVPNPRSRLGASSSASSLSPVAEHPDMKTLLKRLWSEDRGQDVIEYALLAAGISIVIIPIAPLIGDQLVIAYNAILAAVTAIN